MTPRFTVAVDPDLDLMKICMSGFFQPADVTRFVETRNACFRNLRCKPNQHVTLVDIRGMIVQSQDAVVEFEKALHTPGIYSRRIAIVTRTCLSRSQVKRAAHDRDVGYFEDTMTAEAWVLEARV